MTVERRVTLAVILAIIIQTSSGLMWAGQAAERLSNVERSMSAVSAVNERIARLEEQVIDIRESLGRIERKLDAVRAPR